MTKQEFIDSVLAETDVIEVLPNTEKIIETKGDYEKGMFEVLLTEPQGGQNFRQVWFIRNTQTDETGYQTANTVDPKKNNYEAKLVILEQYIADNFIGGFVTRHNLDNNYAEAEVYENGIGRKTILVYKPQGQPITHIDA
jgi:hypothetical protein